MDLSAVWVRVFLGCVVLLGAIALAVLVLAPRGAVAPQQVIRSSGLGVGDIANVALAVAAVGALIISCLAFSTAQRTYRIEVQPVLMLACRMGESSKPQTGWTHVISVPYGAPIGERVVQMFGDQYVGIANNGPSAYQCTLHNYGRLSALNVKLSFQIALRKDNNPNSQAVSYNIEVPTSALESEINIPPGGSFNVSFINSGKLNAFINPNTVASMAKIGSKDRQDVTLNFGQFTFAANYLPHGEPLPTPERRSK